MVFLIYEQRSVQEQHRSFPPGIFSLSIILMKEVVASTNLQRHKRHSNGALFFIPMLSARMSIRGGNQL
jgi:hypothetical protein